MMLIFPSGKLGLVAPEVLILESLKCCGLYRAVLTKYRIKGEMWKAGWFSQERSVKECEGV